MTTASLEDRLRAQGLRIPVEEEAALAEILTMLEDAARTVRAPLPVSAEPANVLILPRPPR